MAKKQKKKNKKLHWVVLLLTLVMLCGCAALGYFVFEIKEIKAEGAASALARKRSSRRAACSWGKTRLWSAKVR